MGPAVHAMSLGNNLLNFYSVPKSQNDRTNWITYKTRLRTVIGAKGLMRHLDGTAQQPSLPANLSAAMQPKTDPLSILIEPEASGSASKGKGKNVKPSEVELDAFEKALEKLEEWEQKQYIVKQQIFSTITDSLLLHVQALNHAHKVWNTMCREFEAKTMMVQIDLRRRLQDTQCDDGTDIRTHFDGLLHMKEELSHGDDTTGHGLFGNHYVIFAEIFRSGPVIHALGCPTSHGNSPTRPDMIAPKPIVAADQHVFFVTGEGNVIVNFPNGEMSTCIMLRNVLYTPSIAFMLVFISRIDESHFSTTFRDGQCQIRSPNGTVIARIPRTNNLYKFVCPTNTKVTHALAAIAPAEANLTLSAAELHCRLGHMSIDAAKSLIRKGTIVAQVESIAGSQYAMTLLDNATYEIMISFLCTKSEAFGKYQTYEKFIKVHRGITVIKNFCSDRGGEYTGTEFEDHLAKQGTHHKKAVHDSSSQNGTTERFFRTSVMHALAMLLASGLPKFLWANTMQHAVWLWNRTGGKITGYRTPFKRVFGDKLDLSNLHEWGCPVWPESKGVLVYWPKKRSITMERNIVWDDAALPPLTDEPPDQWLLDFFDGATTEDMEIIDGGDAMPRDSLTSECMAPDIDPTPAQDAQAAPEEGPNPGSADEAQPDLAAPQARSPGTTHAPSIPLTPVCDHSDPLTAPNAPCVHRTIAPSRYVHLLQAGAGSTTGLPRAPPIPKGMRVEPCVLNYDVPGSESEGDAEAALSEALQLEGTATGLIESDEVDGILVQISDEGIEWGMAAASVDSEEPRTVNEARLKEDWPMWESAIEDELRRLDVMGTWRLTDKPPGANVVGSKWVFKIKRDAARAISKYKACLVAQGFSQILGIDYTDTFAPVAKLSSANGPTSCSDRRRSTMERVESD
ncbi:hypothetical protein EWM64_g10085 [Hericium alpestre]|uniref:Integrase catalytic domain-containing protein n=1 Tax=Hericium alpestre TaxID=135208 RepID=A0A4Y9ZJV1_9AGAM|nr:hypothetical protein EWM64_g10085 [Hericium alpestre]